MSDWDSSRVRWEPDQLGRQGAYGSVTSLPVPRGMAQEMPDELIEEQKPANRGLMLQALQGILQRCAMQAEEDPGDPRWPELELRTLDRLAKLARLYEGQGPRSREGDLDRARMQQQAAVALDALEAKMRGA